MIGFQGSGSTNGRASASAGEGDAEDVLDLRLLAPRGLPRPGDGTRVARRDPAEAAAVVRVLIESRRGPGTWAGRSRQGLTTLVPGPLAAIDGGSPSPTDAGLVAAACDALTGWTPAEVDREFAAFVDHWSARWGVAFAAAATVVALDQSAALAVGSPFGARHRWDFRLGALADRARSLVAAADSGTVAEVVAALGPLRSGSLVARVASSFLVPTRSDWVTSDVAEVVAHGAVEEAGVLVEAVDDADDLARLAAVVELGPGRVLLRSPRAPLTVARSVGSAAAPVLARWADPEPPRCSHQTAAVEALAVLPTDDAFAALLARGERRIVRHRLAEAADRFPRRAARLLSEAAAQGRHERIFRRHVRRHPEAATAALPEVGASERRLLEAELTRLAALRPAPDERLPALLREPPWARPGKRTKPTVVTGLESPTEVRCTWLPGERERWAKALYSMDRAEADAILRRRDRNVVGALPFASTDLVVTVVDDIHDLRFWDLGPVVAAHEAVVHELVVAVARRAPRDHGAALAPYESAAVADLVVGWLDRRTLRPMALAWLRRHAAFAARVLVVTAVGKAGKQRERAGAVLRLLADEGFGAVVDEAGEAHGPKAAAALAEVLVFDPIELVPSRIPAAPAWLSTAELPPVLLVDDVHLLPPPAVDHLISMLLLAKPGEPYPGVARVAADCDRTSVAELAWDLFEQWRRAGAPIKDKWVFDALGSLGDDDTVDRLLRAVLEDTSDPRVVSALDSFTGIGSDAALLALKHLSEKVKTKRVREGAAARIDEVAERLGLTADQLADRLLPDLGLDPDGTTTLDFGPRRFVVSFDQALRPVVADEGGAARKDLPKPGATDDPELAAAATKAFRALKKQVKAHAGDQVRRLERAMVAERRFTVAELSELLTNPVRWPLARRLVWGVYTDAGPADASAASFRLAEDRTFADLDDRHLELAPEALVGVAHPIQLGDDVARWSDLLADYELLQPFLQLGREVFVATAEQLGSTSVGDLAGSQIESVRFLGLEGRGWERREVGDGGMTHRFVRLLAAERALVLDVEPGLFAGQPTMYPVQTVAAAQVQLGQGWGADALALGELGAVERSEVLREVAWLRS